MKAGDGKRILLLLSGGLDSACCLSYLDTYGHTVESLFVHYGQAAAEAEDIAARKVAAHFGSDFRRIDISHNRKFGQGEIIGRNAALIFSALLSTSTLPTSICIGIHAGTPYFDCSQTFCTDLDKIVTELTSSRTSIFTPFVTWHKADIVKFAIENKVPIDITYSCETGNSPCGECASCKDRLLLQC